MTASSESPSEIQKRAFRNGMIDAIGLSISNIAAQSKQNLSVIIASLVGVWPGDSV
jgi:hypothetical protein